MSIFAPPLSIQYVVNDHATGIYPFWVRAIVSAIESTDPRVRLTSWWRDSRTNRRVGGSADSQHLIGLGLDLVSPQPEALAAAARTRGLVAVVYPTHVHIQAWPAGVARDEGILSALGL